MALYRQIDFNKGTVNDDFGAVGTVTNATFSQKEKGMAIQTKHTTNYLTYDKQLLPDGAFTVVAWIKLLETTVIGTNLVQLLGYPGGGSVVSISLNSNTNNAIITLNASGTNYKYFNMGIRDKNWHCLVFTCTGNGISDLLTSMMYIDGTGYNTTGGNITGVQSTRSTVVNIGGGNNTNSGSYISKLKVYDHVLSQQEINNEQIEFNNAQHIVKIKSDNILNKPTDLSNVRDGIENLITQSETPNIFLGNVQQAGWSTNNVIPDTSNNQHRVYGQYAYISGKSYEWTVIAKPNGYNFLSLAFSGGVAGSNIIFNLTNGTTNISLDSSYKGTITPLANGYFKCTLSGFVGNGNTSTWIIVRNANNTSNYIGDGVSGITIQSIQLRNSDTFDVYKQTFATTYPETRLIAAYNFIKSKDNTLVDISGNGNIGTIDNGIIQTKNGLLFGKSQKISTNLITTGKYLTVSFRINKKMLTEVNRIIFIGTCQFGFSSATSSYCHIGSNSGVDINILTCTTNALTEQTITYTINLKDNLVAMYINGILVGSNTLPNSNSGVFNSTTMIIGNTGSQSIDGELIDLRIYNKILNIQEIKDYHNSFVKITLLENFSDLGADNQITTPKDWIKINGSFKVIENNISKNELINNGNFNSDTIWNHVSTSWSINNNSANYDGINNLVNLTQNNINFILGKRYIITFKILSGISRISFNTSGGGNSFIEGEFQATRGVGEYSIYATSLGINNIGIYAYNILGGGVFSMSNLTIKEIQQLPTIQNGTKLLSIITSTGKTVRQSNIAYGVWQFDYYKTNLNTNINFIASSINGWNNIDNQGYFIQIASSTYPVLYKANGSTGTILINPIGSVIQQNVFYTFKILRTINGVFTLLIKGGTFIPTIGYNDYTFLGSATDNTIMSSNYFIIDGGQSHIFGNIIITNGIKQ